MTHHHKLSLVALLVLAASAVSEARADEVVLRNGRTLVGTITEESTKTLRIELSSGSMTVDRGNVVEIRRGPVPEKSSAPVQPKSEGPRIKGGPEKAGPVSKSAEPAPSARSGGADTAKLLIEMERITLATWPDEPPVPATLEESGKFWRTAREDGTFEYSDSAPAEGGTRKVWKQVRNVDGEKKFILSGIVEFVWQPMHWDAARREWSTTHPAFTDFQRDSAFARRICETIANKDAAAWTECNVQKESIAKRQAGKVRDTSVNVVPERERMLAAAVRCTGSEPAAKALVKVLELEIDMQWGDPAEKIRLAVERRELLKKMTSPEK